MYAIYDGKLAVAEPGLPLGEIYERCVVPLGLPSAWSAHVGDDDVGADYRSCAGDVIEFSRGCRPPHGA